MAIDELTERMNKLCATHPHEAVCLSELLLSQGEEGLLICLAQAGEPILSGELAHRSELSTGRVANLLRQLEAKGLVLRTRDSNDGRKIFVELTDSGMAEARKQMDELYQARKRLLAYLGEDDAHEFVRLLDRCLRFSR